MRGPGRDGGKRGGDRSPPRSVLREYLAWVAAGVLAASPFQADALEPLVVVAPIPLLWLAVTQERPRFLPAWLGLSVAVGAGLWWLNDVHPVATMVCAVYFSLYPVAGLLAIARLRARFRMPLVALAPLGVLAYETLLQRFSLLETTFLAWGTLAWRWIDLAQVASIGGVSLVSAALWLVPAGLTDALLAMRANRSAAKRPATWAPLGAGLALLGVFVLAGQALRPGLEPAPLMRVALVQGNVPQAVRNRPTAVADIVRQHARLTEERAQPPLDLVAWPESTASLPLERDAAARALIGGVARRAGAPVLLGAIGLNDDGPPSNSAFLVDRDGVITGRSDKRILVPGAETLLLIDRIPALRDPLVEALSRALHFRPYLRAGRESPVHLAKGVPVGVLICYDDIVSGIAEELRARGAVALVTITNEAWFGRGELRQHLAMAIFRCIETRLPMARCGNDGITCVIDPAGRVVESLPAGTEDVLVAFVPSTAAQPIPPAVRAIVGWASVALVLAGILLASRRTRS